MNVNKVSRPWNDVLCEVSVLCALTMMLSNLKIQRAYQTHGWHEPAREINAGTESG